jgi:hypothetical protein
MMMRPLRRQDDGLRSQESVDETIKSEVNGYVNVRRRGRLANGDSQVEAKSYTCARLPASITGEAYPMISGGEHKDSKKHQDRKGWRPEGEGAQLTSC